jgi:hypothetical protein
MNKLMVGRENRMIDLKRELNDLSRQLNVPPRYTAPDNTLPTTSVTNI